MRFQYYKIICGLINGQIMDIYWILRPLFHIKMYNRRHMFSDIRNNRSMIKIISQYILVSTKDGFKKCYS